MRSTVAKACAAAGAALWLIGAAPPSALEKQIESVLAATPDVQSAFIGIEVISLRTGRTLVERNQDRLFVPASNTKLFTTALALMRLGSNHRFKTVVTADHAPDMEGTVAGDLVLVGGGDPSLSARVYPYRKPQADEGRDARYSLAPVEELADQLISAGVKTVTGDIVGDDRRYVWQPHPESWSVGDTVSDDGAPVSALMVDDNTLALSIGPGENPGDQARIAQTPALAWFALDNRVRTEEKSKRRIYVARPEGSSELRVWGTIPLNDPGETTLVSVGDPAEYAAGALRDALARHGVSIRGRAVACHRWYDEIDDRARGDAPFTVTGVELAHRFSPPLAQILQVVDKVSQNLHAEVMLREVGAVRRNLGSREAGLAELSAFVAEAGIKDTEYRFGDGSGLSRTNLVSPAAVVKLLVRMYRSGDRDLWIGMLPVAGLDGTLARRFENRKEARKIQAKTGTLSHVRAFSGYAQSPLYGPLAFSILINNAVLPGAEMTKFIDKLGWKLLR
jgi:D-alanyl-D-alanine carboxypeptidase/D-alanyl-D-alanine-endopeptidase (penicillin-binding protein 4)